MNFMMRRATGFARNALLSLVIAAGVVACGGGGGSGYGGGGGTTTPPVTPSAYTRSILVSDGAVPAVSTDTHLRNPWGLAALPTGPWWIANNHDHTSTVYDGTGTVTSTVVNIPTASQGPGEVTGIVASTSTTDFMVTNGTTSAPARFLFVTESGALDGWAPTVDATNAKVAFEATDGAQYTGLAIAGSQLFAADFHNRKIDIFSANFTRLDGTGKFTDATLPTDYGPFNIQAIQRGGTTVLAVAYAKRDAVSGDEVKGAGLGIVEIYSTAGALITKLVAQGTQLNAPWGLAVAPDGFGTLSGALLVGNFGDGRINGYDLTTGTFIHVLADGAGTPIVTDGLWGIGFGNGVRNQPTKVLYVTAGNNGEADGIYARIDLGATAPDIAAPTAVSVTAPAAAATVSGTVSVTANASDNVGVARVVFSVRVGTTTTDINTANAAPFSVNWNTGTVANGAATLTATAYDAYGNSTTPAGVAVTVNNVPRHHPADGQHHRAPLPAT
ncbi:MAG: TIGR03118 family protein [Pseudomonadota bacterium]